MAIVKALARTLPEFLHIASRLSDRWEGPWFRGQSRASYDLVPGRYRYRQVDEDEMRSEFKRRASQFLPGMQPRSEWERYFLMQHYGVPTRLLDWSEGAVLALHFALINNRGQCDATVWALDPFWLNGKVIENEKLLPDPDDDRDREVLGRYLSPEPFPTKRLVLPELPIALQPPHIDRRIAAQATLRQAGQDSTRLEGYTWHCNRHTFASRLVVAQVDLRAVQALGGWRTLAMVQRYSHLSPDHLRDAVERLASTTVAATDSTRIQPEAVLTAAGVS